MLGNRRFNIVVHPDRFSVALQVLATARANHGIDDVGLIDLAKAKTEARPALQGSLAEKVQTDDALVHAYIAMVLGDIMTCESVHELRRHRRAVTADVVAYGEWTARLVPERTYRPNYVGQRAQRSQIEVREQEVERTVADLSEIAPVVQAARDHAERVKHTYGLHDLRRRLDGRLDDQDLRATIALHTEQIAALDMSSVEDLERQVAHLQGVFNAEDQAEKLLIAQRAEHQTVLGGLEKQRPAMVRERDTERAGATEAQDRHRPYVEAAQAIMEDRLERRGPEEALTNARNQLANFATQLTNARQELGRLAVAFNTQHSFAAPDPYNPDEPRYAELREMLASTELPRYTAQIAEERRKADEELREHVLHNLRDNILKARGEVSRINNALARLPFGEKYQFEAHKAADLPGHYYDLIMEYSQRLGSGSLFESSFYTEHKELFDEFYKLLTTIPQTDVERAEQERLKDYRSYLTYDIKITHTDGHHSFLSQIMGSTSGGETQMPFYIAIAASFVQLYRIYSTDRHHRSTIRLVVFDEAFSKMDADRIGAILDLFHRFGLQIVTATPLERVEYLAPKMETSLVLTVSEDNRRVLIDPYRNFAMGAEDAGASDDVA
jgi:hypothetical protein